MTTPIVAYYRVSTDGQRRSGLGLEAQQHAVREYARRVGQPILAEFTEVESGRRPDRPELAKAVARGRLTGASLVVAKLDRLTRDVRLLLSLVDSGVRIVFLDLPVSGDPIVGRLVLTILAAIAEFEARRIGQRIREAFAARRARGLKMRAPAWITDAHRRANQPRAVRANRRLAAAFRSSMRPIAGEYRAAGRTLAGVAAAMNDAGYRTRRGKMWTVATVDALLRVVDEWEGC